jgi:hypothetical protein
MNKHNWEAFIASLNAHSPKDKFDQMKDNTMMLKRRRPKS